MPSQYSENEKYYIDGVVQSMKSQFGVLRQIDPALPFTTLAQLLLNEVEESKMLCDLRDLFGKTST